MLASSRVVFCVWIFDNLWGPLTTAFVLWKIPNPVYMIAGLRNSKVMLNNNDLIQTRLEWVARRWGSPLIWPKIWREVFQDGASKIHKSFKNKGKNKGQEASPFRSPKHLRKDWCSRICKTGHLEERKSQHQQTTQVSHQVLPTPEEGLLVRSAVQ